MTVWQSRFCEVTKTTFYQSYIKDHEEWSFEISKCTGGGWDLMLVSDVNQYSKQFGNYLSRADAESVAEELVAMLFGTFSITRLSRAAS